MTFGKKPTAPSMTLSERAARRRQRRRDNDELAKSAKYWRKPGSAERLGHTRPVDRDAARALSHRKKKKER